MTEPKGKYVKHGDVEEWEWEGEGPGAPKQTGGWDVPEGEFDPRAPFDSRSASEKLAEKGPKGSLTPAEQPEPKKAADKK